MSGNRLTFGRRLPERFRHAHDEVRRRGESQIFGPLPDPHSLLRGYVPVRVSAMARSHDEAVETALDTLDLLRGVWNLYLNGRVGMRLSGGRRKPVNRILLGPVHSLHKPSGALASEYPWVEPDYVEPLRLYRLRSDWADLRVFERQLRNELSSSRYGEKLEDAIRRYVRALDRRDWNTSFVRLWGVLDSLTDTSRDRYEVTIERVLFLMNKQRRDFDRQILRHLTTYRNRTVHDGHETEAIETLLYQLKRYIETVLNFHLRIRPRFPSLEDAARFLSMPAEQIALRERFQIITRALQFQGRA